MCAAFCSGDPVAFSSRMSALIERHSQDTLIAHLAAALSPRLRSPPARRAAIWVAIEDALTPERCVAESLTVCCVAPSQMEEWLAPLRSVCELMSVSVLREPSGVPIAWKIEGVRAAA